MVLNSTEELSTCILWSFYGFIGFNSWVEPFTVFRLLAGSCRASSYTLAYAQLQERKRQGGKRMTSILDVYWFSRRGKLHSQGSKEAIAVAWHIG
jgi:hypothetical protein